MKFRLTNNDNDLCQMLCVYHVLIEHFVIQCVNSNTKDIRENKIARYQRERERERERERMDRQRERERERVYRLSHT